MQMDLPASRHSLSARKGVYMRRVVPFQSSVSLILALLLAVPFVSFAGDDKKSDPDAIGDRNVAGKVNWYSLEKEIALGKQLAQQVERQSKIVNDPVIAEYVNRIGQNLVRNSDAKVPFTIKVIEDPTVNAFALPGGFFFVQTGLILKADNEAELAGVMAHEIAHVAARHGTRQATQSQIGQITTIPLIFLGGWGGICALGASRLVPVGLLSVERGYEAEADLLGLQYLYKSGYDPLGMVEVFERIFSLDDHKHPKASRIFSTHPDGDNRLVTVQKNIEALLKAQPQYIVTTSQFNDMQARLISLEWDKKPEPAGPKPPTLYKSGDEIAKAKKLVSDSGARASQIKEAYTVR